MTLTCSCPSTDGVECLQIRYSLNLDEAHLEPCACPCHLPENQPKTVYEWEEDDADLVTEDDPDGVYWGLI